MEWEMVNADCGMGVRGVDIAFLRSLGDFFGGRFTTDILLLWSVEGLKR
jgi:hypothetical protein